jgi:Glucosidase II beta subunit-like protein
MINSTTCYLLAQTSTAYRSLLLCTHFGIAITLKTYAQSLEAKLLRQAVACTLDSIAAAEQPLKAVDTAAQQKAQQRLDTDFSPNLAYASLADTCLKHTAGSFSYELCLFNHARQGSVNIGTWRQWQHNSSSTGSSYTHMLMDNGSMCPNGQRRKTVVTLQCAVETALVDVVETAVCVYSMTVGTPAACSDSDLCAVEAQLDALGVDWRALV